MTARAQKKRRSSKKNIPTRPPNSSHTIRIRLAAEGDQDALQTLIHQLFPRASSHLSDRDDFLVAESGGRLVGFVHLRQRAAYAYLQGLGVHPVWRRRGVGTHLLEAALDWTAKKNPSNPIRLKVKAANQPALHLYIHEGFMLSKTMGGSYLLSRQENN